MREKIDFKNGEKKNLGVIFSGLGEILVSCLHTLLRDQTPCSSLPENNFFCGLVCFFNFENDFWEEKRGLKGMRLEKSEVVSIVKAKG